MSVLDVFIRIIIAAALAGVIGFEREIREHTAGFRTHILVGVGAAAFTIASFQAVEGLQIDPTRIASGIVTGIGFLGAGAIIRYGVSVRGLTTAASLWTVAALGLLAAEGALYAALITTAVVIASLTLLRLVENRLLYRRTSQEVPVRVHFNSPGYAPLAQLVDVLQQAHVIIKEMGVAPGDNDGDTIHLLLDLPRTLDATKLTALIADLHEVRTVRIE
jgi:putative Mg2+ transporter-C (MgtC) family protein